MSHCEGILLVNKPKGKTSFSLIGCLRRILNIKTIGHAGTLDPLATGVMVLMVGKNYTRLSSKLLVQDKEYYAEITLGQTTDTYDAEGQVTASSNKIPSKVELMKALENFQGEFLQTPPMFSAKKVNGQKLCDLARKGKSVEREPVKVTAQTTLLDYCYPKAFLKINCSKGTYIRSIAYDLGVQLGCGAYLSSLQRTKSGSFHLEDCIDGKLFFDHDASEIVKSQVVAALKKQI